MSVNSLLAIVMVAFLLAGCAAMGQQSSNQERSSEINTELGMTYLQQGNERQAKDSLDKALEQNPNNALAHATMAVLQERLERHDEARRHFQRSIRLDGDNASVRNNYGRFLCNRGEYAAAREQFERAIADSLYERRELALANAGLCALQAGETGEAEDYLRRSLEQSPTFAPALRRMAELRYETEDYLSARGYIQRYREVSRMNAGDLWLAIRIEHALGNEDDVASYGVRLRSDFPDSEETRLYNQLRRDGRT